MSVTQMQPFDVGAGFADSPQRCLPEEVPVALVFNNTTHAVMMATPRDLEDFATGFAITESISAAPPPVEVRLHRQGAECRLWLPEDTAQALLLRRRAQMGPVGCGLCGVISLDEAVRPLAPLGRDHLRLSAVEVAGAERLLRRHQPLHDETRAVHAAGFLQPGRGLICAREDVGRHNALDKLAGALHRAGLDPASGAVVITSRVSVDMVQKTVALGAPMLIALSAPTTLALEQAEAAGLTLVGNASRGAFEIFAHGARILP